VFCAVTVAEATAAADESADAAFASAFHAFCIHIGGSRPEEDSPALPGEWVLAALERKDAALRGPVPPDPTRCPCQDDDEEGPLERQERALQARHFEDLLAVTPGA